MSYLYGDSTPSSLQVNFIELLRDAIDFSVEILLAEQRLVEGRAGLRERERTATAELERLERLAAAVSAAVTGAPAGAADTPAARYAAAVLRAAGELARAAETSVRAALGEEAARLEAEGARERDGCSKALERLLIKHDVPESTFTVLLAAVGGTRYACRAHMGTALGLSAKLELDVPPANLFAQLVRVDRVLERLEVHAPEMGGWLHKEVKMRPHRLDRLHVTELGSGSLVSRLKLRSNPDGTGDGFDVTVRAEEPRVQLTRVEERDGAAPPPVDVEPADAAKLLALQEKLAEPIAELLRNRKAVLEATFDDEPLGAADKPSLLVERLVERLAPEVQEIAARSLGNGELVLRRLLGDDRREEIFVSKEELRRKLEPLSRSRRALFDPLWLDRGAGAAAPLPRKPPPAPPLRIKRPTPPLGSPLPGPDLTAAAAVPEAIPVATPVAEDGSSELRVTEASRPEVVAE